MSIEAAQPERGAVSTEHLATTDSAGALQILKTTPQGLSSADADERLSRYGPNEVKAAKRSLGGIAREQVTSGINILLALAGVLTLITGSPIDSGIILGLLMLNIGLSVFQEYRAERALDALRALLPINVHVWRDGAEMLKPAADLVPGDVIAVRSGDIVPADARVLEADGLEIDQATLTGESVPQAKSVEPVAGGPPTAWTDVLFAGTTAVSGEGLAVIVATGGMTQFGETASLVRDIQTPSDFQVNLAHFGTFLLRFGIGLAVVVFIANALLGHGVLVSLTLALTLMLGMVPEALPAVTATTLAIGAARLARQKVLVRRLASVQDLSVLDVLCLDKTGTITENRTAVVRIWTQTTAAAVLHAAAVCSTYPSLGSNIIDDAIVAYADATGIPLGDLRQMSRSTILPFSSEHKRTCVAVVRPDGHELISKGAADVILGRCTRLRAAGGDVDLDPRRFEVQAALADMQASGARVIAVAARLLRPDEAEKAAEDTDLTLLGLVALSDPPRPGAAAALAKAAALHVAEKIVTGDALPRAQALAVQVGLLIPQDAVVDAKALRGPDAQLAAERGHIFADVVPADKFRLVRALQALGHRVGMTGDGVNDAPALKAADVGIAMASGSDAAKGAADLVLLEDNLEVIVHGIEEGRRLFTNINRYLLYTMVSNFANVTIVAIASLFLPFIPLLPAQVLLLNVLADLPMLVIVTDRVARSDVATPRHWDVRHIMELTVYLGIVNALFAFGLLRFLAGQPAPVVYSSWFLLLGVTALLILFVVRTPGWVWQAPMVSPSLGLALVACLVVTVGLVNVPLSRTLFGFALISWRTQLAIGGYSLLYVIAADVVKQGYLRAAGLGRSGSARMTQLTAG
jgi:P-type Mg2+ transporter